MLPIATPPNAVIFGSGKIKISDMVRTGFLLNIISTLIISIVSFMLIQFVFDVNINTLPGWAN